MCDPLQPDDPQRLGEYRMVGRVSQGNQGVVYLGYAPEGTRVAIKVLHADRDWASVAAQVQVARHMAPMYTAKILRVRLDAPRPYIVSEFIDGPNLFQALQNSGPVTDGGLYRLAIRVAMALTALHEAGSLYGYLKPPDIVLGADGPFLTGIGITHTAEMFFIPYMTKGVGAVAWMAPEFLQFEPMGMAADVYGWAVIVLFAATGRHFFHSGDVVGTVQQVLTAEPDLSALPEPLRPLVGTALAKNPLSRPTASTVLANLRALT